MNSATLVRPDYPPADALEPSMGGDRFWLGSMKLDTLKAAQAALAVEETVLTERKEAYERARSTPYEPSSFERLMRPDSSDTEIQAEALGLLGNHVVYSLEIIRLLKIEIQHLENAAAQGVLF